jgi:hypothetical protein
MPALSSHLEVAQSTPDPAHNPHDDVDKQPDDGDWGWG